MYDIEIKNTDIFSILKLEIIDIQLGPYIRIKLSQKDQGTIFFLIYIPTLFLLKYYK